MPDTQLVIPEAQTNLQFTLTQKDLVNAAIQYEILPFTTERDKLQAQLDAHHHLNEKATDRLKEISLLNKTAVEEELKTELLPMLARWVNNGVIDDLTFSVTALADTHKGWLTPAINIAVFLKQKEHQPIFICQRFFQNDETDRLGLEIEQRKTATGEIRKQIEKFNKEIKQIEKTRETRLAKINMGLLAQSPQGKQLMELIQNPNGLMALVSESPTLNISPVESTVQDQRPTNADPV